MKKGEFDMLESFGVKYIHLSENQFNDRDIRPLRAKCKYSVQHLESDIESERFISVLDKCSALTLVNMWNRDKRWKYVLMECR